MDIIKHLNLPNCALCSLPFSVNGHAQIRSIKLPLILHCGHSACESCLKTELKNKFDFICKVCNALSSISEDLIDVTTEFPVNHYLAGMWYLKIITNCSELDSTIGFSKSKLKKRRTTKAIICNECSENSADFLCKQCDAPYCSPCFKLVHSSAKAFRSHTKVSLFESYLGLDSDKSLMCRLHKRYKLEYYCNPCRAPICSHCMVEYHNGHAVDKIDEVEIDYEEDFIQSYMKISTVLTRLKTTKKSAESILRQNKDLSEIKKTEDEITNYFIMLHGKLSLLENKFHTKLSSATTRNALEDIIKSLNNQIKDIETMLASTRTLFNDEHNKGHYCLAVIENFKSYLNIPCHLVESENWNKPRFIADKEFLNILENHCSLHFNNVMRYQLVSEGNYPSGYEIQPIQSVTKEEVLSILNKTVFTPETLSGCESERTTSPISLNSDITCSSQRRDLPKKSHYYADELAIGCSVSVRVSHLVSPSHFYVQREHTQNKLLDFQASLRPLPVQRSRPPTHPEKGQIYLALYETDKKWYRARIVNVIDIHTYEVFYVDYGNSETIIRSKLREIPRNALNIPFMALRCQLANCVPRYGEDWEPRAVSLMTEIINNDFVTITTIDKTGVAYVVELYCVTDNSFINLREALTFHELSSMTKMFNQTIDIGIRQNTTAPPQHIYVQRDIVDVHVSHVDSPDDFYLQDMQYSRKLIQLSDDLQRVYSNKNSLKNVLYDPKKGMLVAARYSKDAKWYRAKILECLQGKRINVFFIDFGNNEVVIWENIKSLPKRFGHLPPQAIKCRLSDVVPCNNEDSWSEDTNLRFRELVFHKKLKTVVENVNNDNMTVVLFNVTKEIDFCINGVIVQEGIATSIGLNSVIVEYPKFLDQAPDNDCEILLEDIKTKKKTIQPFKPIIIKPRPEHFIKLPCGSVRTQVIVKKIIDPGHFYLMPACYDEGIRSLKLSLHEHYTVKEAIEEKAWAINEKCVIFAYNTFHRAIVLEVLPNYQIKVDLVDEGIEIIVKSSFVHVIDECYAQVPDGVFRSHLGGLEPTLKNWSALSITEFEEFVNNRKDSLYISQIGKIKDNSLPVEMFCKIPLEAGPTEPMKDEWRSLNHYLRFIGQAKSDGKILWDCDGKILSTNEEKDGCVSILKNVVDESCTTTEIYLGSKSSSSSENRENLISDCPDKKLELDDDLCTPNGTVDEVVSHKWLLPDPPENLEFLATPTYIEENGIVYLYDIHKSESLLKEISTALCTKYDRSSPQDHDSTIQPGDICIAKYHLDNKWYRAILLMKKELENYYKIQFVDYGNIEECTLSELRKIPVAQHIPIQGYKCCLHKIVPVDPSGIWIERHIEIIQITIVDQKCPVKLVEIPGSDIYGIERLLIPDGRDLNDFVVEEGFAVYKEPKQKNTDVYISENSINVLNKSGNNSSGNLLSTNLSVSDVLKALESESLFTNQSVTNSKPSILHWSAVFKNLSYDEMPKLKYKVFEIPPVVKSLIVEVSAFLSPLQIILHIEDVDEDPVVLKMLDKFRKVSVSMQLMGPILPPISKPYKCKACCVKFSCDNRWYRGFVLEELKNDLLLVQYVDYGNVEIVPISSVRELNQEWADLEVQGLLCNLHNVTLGNDSEITKVIEALQNCVSLGTVKAEIIERTPIVQVELYIDEKLAYQELIDSKLFNVINDTER